MLSIVRVCYVSSRNDTKYECKNENVLLLTRVYVHFLGVYTDWIYRRSLTLNWGKWRSILLYFWIIRTALLE